MVVRNNRNDNDTFMTWGQAKKTAKIMALICAVLLIVIAVLPNMTVDEEARLVGSWALEGYDSAWYTFYSDGTCKVRGEYGTCQWSITDGKLKIINYYGEMRTPDYRWEGETLIIRDQRYTRLTE